MLKIVYMWTSNLHYPERRGKIQYIVDFRYKHFSGFSMSLTWIIDISVPYASSVLISL